MIVASGVLQSYIERVLGELDGPSALFDRPLAARIKAYLTAGLVRLNALPARHPFWRGRKRKPSFASVTEFFDADHEDDGWVRLAWALFEDRGADFVLRIRPKVGNPSEAVWALAGIRWCAARGGADPVALFRLLEDRLPPAFLAETPEDDYARELVRQARRWRLEAR